MNFFYFDKKLILDIYYVGTFGRNNSDLFGQDKVLTLTTKIREKKCKSKNVKDKKIRNFLEHFRVVYQICSSNFSHGFSESAQPF